MMTVLSVIWFVILSVLLVAIFAILLFVLHSYVYFHWRICKHCHHTLEYKGLKDDDADGHYLFHCPHCGAWEQVSRQKYMRDVDRGFNPNDSTSY